MLTPEKSRVVYRIAVGATWGLIALTVLIDCKPRDVRTSEGLVPHFLAWVMIGVVAITALPSGLWRRLRWPQVVLLTTLALAMLDMLFFYFVGICALGLTTRAMRSHPLGAPLTVLAFLQMFAVLGAAIGAIGAYATRPRPSS